MKNLSHYKAVVESRICGIPCLLGVTSYDVTPPWSGSLLNCPSSLDASGYTELDYDILDRKGYKAHWLSKKLTQDDIDQNEQDIMYYFDRQAESLAEEY